MYYHFSEEKNITLFSPRKHPSYPELPPMVWAIDKERAPLYYFPRNCPRIGYYATPKTTKEDRKRFLRNGEKMVIAIENRWIEKMKETELYCYSFSEESFQLMDEGAGYYISFEETYPVCQKPMGNLFDQLIQAGVELKTLTSLFPLQQELLETSLHFSMIRMKFAQEPASKHP